MITAKIKNWSEFQHYKDRSPPWIKLHRGFLDDFDFARLPIASKALAPMLWLLAAESKDGSVQIDVEYLAFRLRWSEEDVGAGLTPLIDKGFLIVDSEALASRLQDACPERETERETEGETEGEGEGEGEIEPAIAGLSPAAPDDAPPADDDSGEQPNGRPPCPHVRIIALYHEILPELRQVREWNETRRRLLQRRWSESPERQSVDWWREFFGYVRRSRFLMGQTTGRDGRPFDCDLEWLIRPTNFAKVIEGKYEDDAA